MDQGLVEVEHQHLTLLLLRRQHCSIVRFLTSDPIYDGREIRVVDVEFYASCGSEEVTPTIGEAHEVAFDLCEF